MLSKPLHTQKKKILFFKLGLAKKAKIPFIANILCVRKKSINKIDFFAFYLKKEKSIHEKFIHRDYVLHDIWLVVCFFKVVLF